MFVHVPLLLLLPSQLLLVSGANRALGLSDELFVLGDSVILTVLGQVGKQAGVGGAMLACFPQLNNVECGLASSAATQTAGAGTSACCCAQTAQRDTGK